MLPSDGDGSQEGTEEETDSTTDGNAAEDGKTEAQKLAEAGILRGLTAETKRRQAAEARIAEFEAADEARRIASAKKRGEFQGLYEDERTAHDAAKLKLAALETAEADRKAALCADNVARREALPEAYRTLVPDGLEPDVEAAQLARLEAHAGTTTEPASTGSRTHGGVKSEEQIPEACVEQAAKNGRDPQWWWENVYKPRQVNAQKASDLRALRSGTN